jgi:DNA-directed RNA polymerase subunit RPC12/RpoP
MTKQLNQQSSSSDYEPFSASMQRSSLLGSALDDRIQSASHQPVLSPCIYLALSCSRCGSVRQAIAELPAQAAIACPECGRQCTFVLLGSGLTSRRLPFYQVHIIEPTRWDSRLDGEVDSS